MLPSNPRSDIVQVCILTAPSFNLAATTAFVDPFRVANYLYGRRYVWAFQSFGGGLLQASNTAELKTSLLDPAGPAPDFLVVSTSWAPEALARRKLLAAIRRWPRRVKQAGFQLGGIGSLQHATTKTLEGPDIPASVEIVGHAERIDEGCGRRKVEAGGGQDAELNEIVAGIAGQHGWLSDRVLRVAIPSVSCIFSTA